MGDEEDREGKESVFGGKRLIHAISLALCVTSTGTCFDVRKSKEGEAGGGGGAADARDCESIRAVAFAVLLVSCWDRTAHVNDCTSGKKGMASHLPY